MSPRLRRRRSSGLRLRVGRCVPVLAGVLMLGTLLVGSALAVAVAAALAVAAGLVAVHLLTGELARVRRDAAWDRVRQARAYADLDARRTDDHRAAAATLLRRAAEARCAAHEVAGERDLERRRADLAEDELLVVARAVEEADQRAAAATVAVAELEAEVVDLKATVTAWETTAPPVPVLRHA